MVLGESKGGVDAATNDARRFRRVRQDDAADRCPEGDEGGDEVANRANADALDLVATSKERLSAMTFDEVRGAAKTFLRADAMSTLILRPKTAR
jgi:hypothetical protein